MIRTDDPSELSRVEAVARAGFDPDALCESGWTGDRCTYALFHEGPHSNEGTCRYCGERPAVLDGSCQVCDDEGGPGAGV